MLKKLNQLLALFMETSIVAGLFLVLILGVFSIFGRWAGVSPLWIDPLIRHLVLLLAFLGAALASQKNLHIKMDAFTKIIEKWPSKIRSIIEIFSTGITVVVLFFLTYSSYQFFLVEKEYAQEAILGLQSHYLVFIIPFGFSLMVMATFFKWLELWRPNHE
jgi:TRAP-type C4-dicarboxylate transport system permease small subunit